MAKKITPLEWEIMQAVWEMEGELSVRDVLEATYPEGQKAYTTVQTIMNKLEKKGFLRKKKIGLVNFYAPTKKRSEVVVGETKRFVERIFDGSFGELASYLIGSGKLTDKEIEHIKEIIDEREYDTGN
ncbi:MAG: BlaI/MecI/CopY family transcriptional regulator [Candidatus Zixiibacteriota bacterium]